VRGTGLHLESKRGAWKHHRLLAKAHVHQVLARSADAVRHLVRLDQRAVRVERAREDAAARERDLTRAFSELMHEARAHVELLLLALGLLLPLELHQRPLVKGPFVPQLELPAPLVRVELQMPLDQHASPVGVPCCDPSNELLANWKGGCG